MSPGALHLIGEQSSGETSFSLLSGDRRSYRVQAPGTLCSSARRVSSTMSGVRRHLGFLLLAEAVLCAAATRECFLHPPLLSPCRSGFDILSQCSKNGCSLHVQQLLQLYWGTDRRQLAPPQGCLALGRNVT